MFYNLIKVTYIDLTYFDFSKINNTERMFAGCQSLTSIKLPTTTLQLPIKHMNNMFYDCSSLNTLDLSNFKMPNALDISYMFYGCSKLTILKLPNFISSKIININSIFGGCNSLTSLILSTM